MGESSINLSESALNSLKKTDLVQKILDLKGKVIVDTDLRKLSDQICKLTEAIDQVSLEKNKLTSELVITKSEKQVRGKDNKFRKKSGKRGAV